MKKLCCMLLALVLSAAATLCVADMEEELVARERLAAEAVTTMEEAYALIPEEELWFGTPQPSYAQKYGYEPVALTPEAAYDALRAAYDEDQGVESYEALFHGWGLSQASRMEGFIPSYCWPARRTLCEEVETVRDELSIEVVTFYGNGGWEEEGALVFAKYWGEEWKLIDYVLTEPESVLLCGEDYRKGILIQFLCHGHGTGHYSEQIALYNPLSRRCEGSYTRVGHEVPRDYGMYVASQVYTDEGITVLRSTAFATGEQVQDGYVYIQRAQEAHVYVYQLNAQDGSFALTVDLGVENASPALLLEAAGEWPEWVREIIVP